MAAASVGRSRIVPLSETGCLDGRKGDKGVLLARAAAHSNRSGDVPFKFDREPPGRITYLPALTFPTANSSAPG